jgi:hypothetical protein
METRLEYVEALLGDSADKHSKEIDAAKGRVADLHKAIQACAKHDHIASMEERVNFLEKQLGDSADQHAKDLKEHGKDLKDHKAAQKEHKESVETRLEYIEALIGDSADKHAKEIDAAKGKLQDLDKVVNQCARSEHHATLEERLNYLEKFLGESADKHEKDLKEHKKGFADHKTSMEKRLEYMEALLGDSADKHAEKAGQLKELMLKLEEADRLHGKHDSLHKTVEDLEERLNIANADRKKMADSVDDSHSTLHKRLKELESGHGDLYDRLAKGMDAHKTTLSEMDSRLRECGKAEHGSVLERRVDYLEKFLGESVDKHDSHKTSMDSRLSFIEGLLGDSSDKHAKELAAAKDKLQDLHKAVASCAKLEHHASVESRLEFLENFVGDSADKHERATKDLESAHAKNKDLMNRLAGEADSRAKTHSVLQDRIEQAEKKLADVVQNNSVKLISLEQTQSKLKTAYDELGGLLRGERSNNTTTHNHFEDRVKHLENVLGGDFGRFVKEFELSQTRMRDLSTKIDHQKVALEQRIFHMESNMVDPHRKLEWNTDMEQQFLSIQEDQKRARDVLENSFHEQLRLEHASRDSQVSQLQEQWERENKTRLANQETWKEMLHTERASRESGEHNLEKRVEACERLVAGETQRLWLAIDGHTHDTPAVPAPRAEVHHQVVQVPVQAPMVSAHQAMSPRAYVMKQQPVQQNSVVRPVQQAAGIIGTMASTPISSVQVPTAVEFAYPAQAAAIETFSYPSYTGTVTGSLTPVPPMTPVTGVSTMTPQSVGTTQIAAESYRNSFGLKRMQSSGEQQHYS